jgi:DNA-binding MarR family transcriptional regulator
MLAVGDILQRRIKQTRFDSPAQEAILNLLVAGSHVRQMVDEVCAPYKITRAQYNALRILRGAHPGGYPRGEIASRLIERAPDVTRLIDRLEGRKLVERVRSKEDRRLSITRITRSGLDLLRRMDPRMQDLNRRVAAAMSDRHLRQLSKLCEQLYASRRLTGDE